MQAGQFDSRGFGLSTIPLHHEPYGPIVSPRLVGVNKGKVAVVTGAGRGIGRAISISLAHSGARIALLDLNDFDLSQVKEECLRVNQTKVETFNCDITNSQAVEVTFSAVVNALGPIDILVNNAGVATGENVFNQKFKQFWKTVEVNFKGTMLCIFEVLKDMKERNSGCIINVASRAATVDMAGSASYSSSKAAVVRATSVIQEEIEQDGLGQFIQLYCLHPGAVWGAMVTEVQAQIRPIFKDVPELCANTVTYIASGQAKALRGRYFDCRQDIQRVCSFERSTLSEHGLYNLSVKFLPGYRNEP